MPAKLILEPQLSLKVSNLSNMAFMLLAGLQKLDCILLCVLLTTSCGHLVVRDRSIFYGGKEKEGIERARSGKLVRVEAEELS